MSRPIFGLRIADDIAVDLEERAKEAKRLLLLAGVPEGFSGTLEAARRNIGEKHAKAPAALQLAHEILADQYPDVVVTYQAGTFGVLHLTCMPRILLSHLDRPQKNKQAGGTK